MDNKHLKDAIRNKYAWPGGYPFMFVCNDGDALCANCARENYRQIALARRYRMDDGWRVICADIFFGEEDSEYAQCAHCSTLFKDM